MDFFQRIGNFFQGKGWVSDEEKRRKEQEQQSQPVQPKVTFNNQNNQVLNNINRVPDWAKSPSPIPELNKQEPPKVDTAPKVDTVPKANEFKIDNQIKQETKPIIPQKTVDDAPKMLTPQGQQDWVNKENKQIQIQNEANKPIQLPKKPTFFDYANPLGEHGLFGAKQQQNFKKTIEKPIADNVEKFNKWIDSSDKQEGFQWSDPGDYVRFAAKIPGGMVQGLAEAPNKIANTITGIEADENGKVKQLNGWQRLGKGLDAGISVGGLGFGGSGTLIRSAVGQGGKQLAGQAAKQTIAKKALGLGGNVLKDAAKEGAEEVAQTFAQDLADDGKVNTKLGDYAQAGALGALGGGMMSSAGHAVNGVKGVVRNKINPYGEEGVGINRLSPNQMKYNAAEVVGGIAGDTRKRLSQAAFGDLQKARTGNPYRTSDGMDVELSRQGNRKFTNPQARATNENFTVKQRLAPYIDQVIEKSRLIDSAQDRSGHGVADGGFEYRELPVKYRGNNYTATLDIAKSNEHGRNTLYEGNIRKASVLPGELIEPGYNTETSSRNVAREAENVNDENNYATTRKSPMEPAGTNPSTELHHLGDSHVDSVTNNPQNVNTDNRYQHPLQETINEMESNPKPKMTRELRDAIDEFIFENIDQNLFLEHNDTNINGTNGLEWSIPRMHVDDLRHYLGDLTQDLPSTYKRRTGKRDIDTVAQEMGYDDIDVFIDEVKRVAEARRAERERKALLAEWRRDPDVIEEAQKMIAERHAEETPKRVKPPTNTERVSSIEPADINTNDYVNELAKEQKLARKGEQPTLRDRWQDFKADMREKFVDRFAPIEDRITNEADQLEMRAALDRTLRADSLSEAFIRDNKFDQLINSFRNKKEMQMFDQALIAKHALELEKNGVQTGRDLAKDKALIREADKRFENEFAQVREYSDKVLQQTVDYGLISQDTANYLRKKYPEYVPFDRIFSDSELDARTGRGRGGEASLSKQDIVQRINGSQRAIDSPLNALVMKTQDMIQQGERNKTAELLASYAKDPKNPFLLKELKDGEKANGRPTISYLDKGTKRTFLAAPEVANAAKNMNREQVGIILKALMQPARLLRMGATSINAGFTMANVVKDFVGASVNSKNGFFSTNPKVLAKALGVAFHHKGDMYLEMQRAGVLGNSYELTRNAAQLNLKEIRSHKNFWRRSAHNIKKPLQTLENTIGRSEDFGRAVQYLSNKNYAKRHGMSESEAIKFAADQARWNSTNFLRSGSYGKVINAIVPYSNAGIQGQRIMLRRMKENPVRYTSKVVLGVAIPTVSALAFSYGSEKGKEVMDNLPDYVKENNVVIVSPGATYNKEQNRWDGVFMVPVPPQFAPLHRQLHNMTKSVMTGQQFDMGKAAGDAVEQVTTVNPLEIRRTASQYVPQAVKPAIETWANKNLYTGQEVVPEGMKNLAGKDQWDNNTSLTARKFGELTGLSPKQVDNVFRTSTAGGGQNLLHGTDWAIAKATGASDDEIKGRSILDSITGRFYAPKGTSQGSYYYQSLEKAAKDNKLVGSDLEFFQGLTSRKYNENGQAEGKTEADAIAHSRLLASKPALVKALSDAAKWRSEQTGEELDPLYKLPVDKQQYFYQLQGSPKNGAEQRKLKQDAPWLEDFQKERSAYFKRQDFKSGKSNRVPYPEVNDELQATLKTYHDMPSSPQKWAFLDAHPELSDHFKQIEDYNNKVREAQGYAPQRTRPQQSQYVKMQMANKNWRDPAVAKYLQDLNVYNITNSASLAEMQGEDLSPKALRAIQSLGKYGLVKNPDGTFALKYPDGQGTNESHIQPGAVDTNSFWGRGGRRGYRGRGGSTGDGTRTSTDTLKKANATAISMNTFKHNQSSRAPQFTGKAIQLNQLLKSRKPKSRVVTFR
nr:MAG TPA: Type I restriction enzyme Methylase [Caudoviricetes sp.]